jgi:spermidine synthase
MHPKLLRVLIYSCFFLSGATGLIYEVVWAKYLALIIGSTTAAATIVLATFMGGLALGNHLLGRQADRVRNRLKFYGWLEIGIGIYCALSLQIINWGSELYVSLARASFPPGPLIHLLRLFLAGVALLVPTVLMGGTLPVLARLWVRSIQTTARGVATLYSINSFGAVLGSLAAGFFLIRFLGISLSMLAAAAVNILVGLLAISLDRFTGKEADPLEEEAPSFQGTGSVRIMRLALLGAALSGAAAMVYEVGWIRLTAIIWGSSTYSFTVMLAAFITGIALGSVIARSIARRPFNLFWIFGLCELLVAISMLASLPLYTRLPYSFASLGNHLVRTPESFPVYQLLVFLCSMAVMIVPTVFQGMTLPLVTQVASDQLSRLGRSVGRVFSLNTLGTLLGALVAGLFLMPRMGTRHTLEIGVALTLGAAALVFAGDFRIPRSRRIAGFVAGLAALAAYYAFAPAWDQNVLNSGAFRRKNLQATFEEYRQFVGKGKILFQKDGADCTVAVLEVPRRENSSQLILVVNGKTDASTEGDLSTQLLIAHVPLVLYPAAQDVLLVGLGSGITAGGALRHDIRRLDVVEISREVVEAAPLFAPFNNQALYDPRLHLAVDDGKTFLRTVPRRYDVIVNQPSNPWISGIGALLTEEFFWEARNHLNPGGILVQWIQGYEFSDELFKAVLATLRKAFPYVSGWNSLAGDYFFICRVEPLQLDLKTMVEEIAKPRVGESLRRLGIHHLSTLFSLEMMNPQTLAEASEQGISNTDNFPVLEYDAPRAFFVGRGVRETVDLDDRLRPNRWNGLLLKKWIDRKGPLTSPEFEEIVRYQERWGGANPHFLRAVLQQWITAFPRQKEAWQAMARGSANDPTGEFQARGRAASLALDDFDSCRTHAQSLALRFMSGVSLISPQDAEPVLKSLGRCLSLKGSTPDLVFETQGLVLSKIGRWKEAGELFQEAARQRLSRSPGKELSDIAHLHARAAHAYRMGGFRTQALAAAREALAHSPRHPWGRFELEQAEKMQEG